MKNVANKNICPNCQNSWQDNYCSNCGEQKVKNLESSFSDLIKQLFSSITEVDNKFIKSFKLLFLKPGQLTKDYFLGIRKSLLTPFQVFIFANIIYFFMTGLFNQATFATPLKYHINSTNFIHQEKAKEMVENKIEKSDLSYEDYERDFNRVVKTQSKTLIFVFIPILTVFLVPLFFNKRIRTVRHIVYATHFMAFLLLVTMVSIPLVQYLLGLLMKFETFQIISYYHETILSILVFLIDWVYIYLSFILIFNESKLTLFFKSILLTGWIYVALLTYRMFLFFTTYLFIG